MSETLKGMARVIVESMGDTPENAARDALLWLADNVTDEMVKAFWDQFYSVRVDSPTNKAIAAALRAAAGDGK